VQKAAEQRQLSLEPVVRDAIVRQVEKVTPEEATAASKITKYVDMCKEKLPVIEEQLQAALAASRYCSDAHPHKMQPAVMVAVLDGEEVAAAVRKEVVRAEEQAAAQADAANRAIAEVQVLPVIESDQEPPRQEQDPTTAATAREANSDRSATADMSPLQLSPNSKPKPHSSPSPSPSPNPNPNPNPNLSTNRHHCTTSLPRPVRGLSSP